MARILVIDDSAIIRALLTDFLGEQGHSVECAVDGAQGLEMARAGDYDLCFCDLHLPKKNGFQILTELGEDRGSMQFVFTDSLPDELFEQIQASTDFTCLRKPFDLDQLRRTLAQVLERVRTA
jgi:CheY-like chemotaxis protein